ncbi:MAG: hypothetical protein QNJ12_07230 [Ilumatobacter sp.]|uniref:hypothetical protein n=1 Tax=Ilumatobacter sp. TaxID=1967498 RepID=UPI002606D266|nr:hypothetical protein [Ilumatobacter sp.]MDJ0768570.1 hypothetical protein [Ilumatobacter sp.]
MIVRPMIADWQVPNLTSVEAVESKRVAVLPVPGLRGDLQQDLGTSSLEVRLIGSLFGDEARDEFLGTVRERFLAGEPVTFVADITTATELEEVLIVGLEVSERAASNGECHYSITLREYVEPPEPPLPFDELGADLLPDLSDLAAGLLDGLELPDLLGALPSISDPVAPVMPALDAVAAEVDAVPALLDGVKGALGL